MTEETRKALEDKSPLVGHLRFQPQGYPRNAWRLQNVAHPSTWDREHWSWRPVKRASNASKKRPQTAVEAATKLLKQLLEKK